MQIVINALIILLIFVLSFIANTLPWTINAFFGLPAGFELIFIFAFSYLMTFGFSNLFAKNLTHQTIAITLVVTFLLFIALNFLTSTAKYSVKISPYYISWILGFLSGVLHYRSGFNLKKFALLALFPVIMSINLYDLWIHRIEYGNFTGAVANPEMIPFEFVNKEEELVSNTDLKGKVVWLDFWFIGCRPCWEVFPEVQRIHDENKDNPSFALYAVNRNDDPEKVFTRIEEKGYTFPVLRGTQEKMDDLGVYVYPTVILLNKKGEIVFMGEFDKAESMLESLLDENKLD